MPHQEMMLLAKKTILDVRHDPDVGLGVELPIEKPKQIVVAGASIHDGTPR